MAGGLGFEIKVSILLAPMSGRIRIDGNDRLEDGRQAYSTYLELGYHKSFSPEQHLSLSLGATPFKSFYTDYRSGAAWVNLTLQYRVDLKLGSWALPMSVSYTLNTQREKSYVYLSIMLRS